MFMRHDALCLHPSLRFFLTRSLTLSFPSPSLSFPPTLPPSLTQVLLMLYDACDTHSALLPSALPYLPLFLPPLPTTGTAAAPLTGTGRAKESKLGVSWDKPDPAGKALLVEGGKKGQRDGRMKGLKPGGSERENQEGANERESEGKISTINSFQRHGGSSGMFDSMTNGRVYSADSPHQT
jgi:hypothetical protein